jgi:probable rRNA maturation factor
LECLEVELSLVLVDDAEISALNAEYLGRTGPTNVIAFPMTEGPFGDLNPGMLGDVVLSVETVRTQAADGGFTLEEMLDFYMIHGILHLLGYDHVDSGEEAALMDAKTMELWHMLGHEAAE